MARSRNEIIGLGLIVSGILIIIVAVFNISSLETSDECVERERAKSDYEVESSGRDPALAACSTKAENDYWMFEVLLPILGGGAIIGGFVFFVMKGKESKDKPDEEA